MAAQTYANHTRFDPLFHFFLLPVAAINVGATIWNLFQNPGLPAGWFVILAIAGAVAVTKIRNYALKAQDRGGHQRAAAQHAGVSHQEARG